MFKEHVCQCQKSKVMAKGLKRTKAIVSRSLLDIKYIFYCQNTWQNIPETIWKTSTKANHTHASSPFSSLRHYFAPNCFGHRAQCN